MDRKMMLSMPRTISSSASVRNETRPPDQIATRTRPLPRAALRHLVDVAALFRWHEVTRRAPRSSAMARNAVDRGIRADHDADRSDGEAAQRLAAERREEDHRR
jgi:hypothetical protein